MIVSLPGGSGAASAAICALLGWLADDAAHTTLLLALTGSNGLRRTHQQAQAIAREHRLNIEREYLGRIRLSNNPYVGLLVAQADHLDLGDDGLGSPPDHQSITGA